MARKRVGFWYRLAVVVLKPLLLLIARRDWQHRDRLPRTGGIVVVANHTSHLDPLAVAHYLWDNDRPPRALAKSSLFGVFFVGRLLRGAGQIPVYRETTDAGASLRDAVDAVRRGEAVLVYPEGTITRDPRLWPMRGKTGAARIALTTDCPVIPVAQWGPQAVLAPYSRRFRLFPRRTFHLVTGEPVDLDDLRGRPLTAEVLDEATDRIIAALTELVAGLRGEVPPTEPFDQRTIVAPRIGDPKLAYERLDDEPRRHRRQG